MKTEEIRDLAIKRHDIDANHFQTTYSGDIDWRENIFLYGRHQILEEIDEQLASLPKGAKILDIGSGTGHLTKYIKDKGFEVVGIEPAEEMIGFARQNFPDIEFMEGISSELPFEDNTFDFIVAFEVFRYINEEENLKGYREFKRVLKDGGKIFITHVNKYAKDYYRYFHPINGFIYSLQSKPHHYCYFTTPEKEEKILEGMGYKEITTIGRLDARARIAFKLGKSRGINYVKNLEAKKDRQRYTGRDKRYAGHLMVIATV